MTACIRPESSTYTLLRCLGEGLSSRVFAAIRKDSRGFSEQRVVLKILKTETDVTWLRNEFAALARIRSPHCVTVLGWENLPDGPALVLEQVDGVTLRDFASEHAFTAAEIEELIAQTHLGLCAVHDAGLVHGDLSPSKIMIDCNGVAKIMDFARGSTRSQIIGTPAYTAPEIWDGHAPSRASDLFSLAMIEHDLKSGFSNVPRSTQASRARAQQLKLARSRTVAERSEPTSLLLGKKVAALLAKREAQQHATQRLKPQKSTRRFRMPSLIRVMLAMFLMMVFVPALSRDQVGGKCRLEIRSQEWLAVEIDGHPLGYAPIDKRDFEAGLHLIKWWTASREGQLKMRLVPGQTLRISTRDLIVQP